MDRENFLETVKKQFTEEIHSAYVSCQHTGANDNKLVDITELQSKLYKIRKGAIAEGLTSRDFEDMVNATIPDINGQLSFKKAA